MADLDRQRAPHYARPFAAAVVVWCLVVPVLGLEPWPASSWRLFTQTREPSAVEWRAIAFDGEGAARGFRLYDLPRNADLLPERMNELRKDSPAERDRLCEQWLAAVPQLLGSAAGAVEIHGYKARVGADHEVRRDSAPSIRYRCDAEGLREL